MSRKAMKKTLKRMQQNAILSVEHYDKILGETYGKPVNQFILVKIMDGAQRAVADLYNYARTLEDAYEELAEPLDKKLEKMKKAVENMDKPVKKTDDKKRPFYTS